MDMPSWLSALLAPSGSQIGLPPLQPIQQSPGPMQGPQPQFSMPSGPGPALHPSLFSPRKAPAFDPMAAVPPNYLEGAGLVPSDAFWENLVGGAKPTVAGGAGQPSGPSAPSGIPRSASMPGPGGLPTFNSRPVSPLGTPQSFDLGSGGGKFPTPSLMDSSAVPQEAPPVGADFGAMRAWMDKAASKNLDTKALSDLNASNVFAGLARGAGGVSATEPGSFAKALAMAGAGGSAGRSEAVNKGMEEANAHDLAVQHYATQRADQEMKIAGLNAEVANAQRRVDFQNAKGIYDNQFTNNNLVYENQLKQYGMEKPVLHNVPDGIFVETTDPQTGKISGTFHPTKPLMEHLDGIGKTYAGLGMDPSAAQLQAISADPKTTPGEKQHLAEQIAMRDIISKSRGQMTFGADYDKAVKSVNAALKADPTWAVMSATKPVEASKKWSDSVADALHNAYANSGSDEWKQKMIKGAGQNMLPYLIGGANAPPAVGP
jgi:hypothetical protein